MNLSLDSILALIIHYGYFFLFITSILEGPIITVLGGFLASQGYFNPYIVYLVMILGDIVGELLFYIIGRFGMGWIGKTKSHFFDSIKNQINNVKGHYGKYSAHTIIIGKLTHSMGFAALIGAGVAEMPILPFLFYNTIAGIPKSLAFLLIGYYFGSAYNLLNKDLKFISIIIFFVILSIIIFLYWRHKKRSANADLKYIRKENQ